MKSHLQTVCFILFGPISYSYTFNYSNLIMSFPTSYNDTCPLNSLVLGLGQLSGRALAQHRQSPGLGPPAEVGAALPHDPRRSLGTNTGKSKATLLSSCWFTSMVWAKWTLRAQGKFLHEYTPKLALNVGMEENLSSLKSHSKGCGGSIFTVRVNILIVIKVITNCSYSNRWSVTLGITTTDTKVGER